MQIKSVRVTPIAIKDPPLLNAAGVHEPWGLRTIIEVAAEHAPKTPDPLDILPMVRQALPPCQARRQRPESGKITYPR